MLDLNYIRNNPNSLDENLIKRGMKKKSNEILKLDYCWRNATKELNDLRRQSKLAAEERNFELGKEIKLQIKQLEEKEKNLYKELTDLLSFLPNIISKSVPKGENDSYNVEIKKWDDGFSKNELTHDLIIQKTKLWHDLSDVSGARFAMMRGWMSKLERSIANWMLDFNVENGFQEVSVPFMVKENSLYNSGQLPKFKEDLFISNDKFLIPTGEVPLINMFRGSTLKDKDFPNRFTALSHCFRKEAGSAGKDTKGLIRLHQFQKVEIISITNKDSYKEHEFMLNHAETLLKLLKLPYRVVDICSGDIGFTAHRQFDLEVWMPGMNKYVEISSCSNCTDFQARRMNTKYIDEDGNKHFAHTLNCSALAVGRTLAAILENYYKDGFVYIPDVLQNYMKMEKVQC